MTWRFVFVSLFLVMGYVQLFLVQEKQSMVQEVNLTPALPTQVLKVLAHTYMEQMVAEILFIKVAVFTGSGYQRDEKNLDVLANHFLAMTALHPKLEDIYYRTESALPDNGKNYVQIANQILESGRKTYPTQVALPYFEGFNYYYYLDEPVKAAELLRLASTYDEKYQWLGHLASTLDARGGNIRVGLTWLKGMYASMQEGDEKERYAKDIKDYEKALQVQLALERFKHKTSRHAKSLSELVPSELIGVPELSAKFEFAYDAGKLFLRVKNSRKKS